MHSPVLFEGWTSVVVGADEVERPNEGVWDNVEVDNEVLRQRPVDNDELGRSLPVPGRPAEHCESTDEDGEVPFRALGSVQPAVVVVFAQPITNAVMPRAAAMLNAIRLGP